MRKILHTDLFGNQLTWEDFLPAESRQNQDIRELGPQQGPDLSTHRSNMS